MNPSQFFFKSYHFKTRGKANLKNLTIFESFSYFMNCYHLGFLGTPYEYVVYECFNLPIFYFKVDTEITLADARCRYKATFVSRDPCIQNPNTVLVPKLLLKVNCIRLKKIIRKIK